VGKKKLQIKVTVRRFADDLPSGGGGMKSHGNVGNGNPSRGYTRPKVNS
jgi:hypothetical protein